MTTRASLKSHWQRTLRLDLALRFIWQSTPGWTMANVALVVIQAPLPLASLVLIFMAVDRRTVRERSPAVWVGAAVHGAL